MLPTHDVADAVPESIGMEARRDCISALPKRVLLGCEAKRMRDPSKGLGRKQLYK